MNVLLDTNILLRSIQQGHPQCQTAEDAISALRVQGFSLRVVPQNLYEFWAVCTRPLQSNGLGKTITEARGELRMVHTLFHVAPDTPAIYPVWESLVSTIGATGKTAHDARLVAAMQVHGMAHLLTFNDADFRRYPNISVFHPAAVIAVQPPQP